MFILKHLNMWYKLLRMSLSPFSTCVCDFYPKRCSRLFLLRVSSDFVATYQFLVHKPEFGSPGTRRPLFFFMDPTCDSSSTVSDESNESSVSVSDESSVSVSDEDSDSNSEEHEKEAEEADEVEVEVEDLLEGESDEEEEDVLDDDDE